jgi:hypothetical protein
MSQTFKTKLDPVWRPMLLFVLILFFSRQNGLANDKEMERHLHGEMYYPIELFNQGDYFRSLSEIKKLRFKDNKRFRQYRLDIYLLRNYYFLKDYTSVLSQSVEVFKNASGTGEVGFEREAIFYYAKSMIQLGKTVDLSPFEKASPSFLSKSRLPVNERIPGLIDPDKAMFYSSIVPGSGLLLSHNYQSAVVSFVLNGLFITACYRSAMEQRYGIAGLLLFFEIGWYSGGRNASYESALKFNTTSRNRAWDNWYTSQKTNTP